MVVVAASPSSPLIRSLPTCVSVHTKPPRPRQPVDPEDNNISLHRRHSKKHSSPLSKSNTTNTTRKPPKHTPASPHSMSVKRDVAAAALDMEGDSKRRNGSTQQSTSEILPQKEPTEEQKNRMLKQSKRMKKLLASDPAAAEKMDYRRRVGMARRDDDVPTALQLFTDIQARNIDVGHEGFNALIALLTTFERQAEAEAVLTYMREKHVPLTEATYVSMMRALALGSKLQKPEAAEALLDEMLSTGQRPRLRSYSPIVVGYAQQGKINAAFQLYDKMLTHKIEPTEVELVALLKVCGEARREGGKEGGGKKVEERFYRVMREMQELVLEPGEGAWEAMKEWFATAATPAAEEVKVTSGVVIDNKGVCGECGQVLDSIDLTSQASGELLTMVEELVLAEPARAGDWEMFKSWLEGGRESARTGWPEFDVVVDGANVGYFQMNYAQAPPHVNYEQISWVVEHFERRGKRPLLVLHARHVDDRKIPPEYVGLVRGWRERGLLLVVPYRNNDDWFWLFTTVFKGGRTLLVTNDEMRDHHFQMLSQRTFLRWKERHQAYFSFGGHERGGGRSVKIEAPAVYSRCIQGPRSMKEGSGKEGGESWHLPKAGSEEWMCVQVRRKDGEEGVNEEK